ncbi:molecular chaperone DnaK [Advenella incenata]|uniref:Molecular chaperone DnaK n=1 Tax=Advenella incenata TaxID=267800 RepID=A0A4Q7VQ36_9BURK|nr:Hsp70 family protein [Advenella incenata]RZT98268.1 molecular chaperone DnaK [Advenella incenata]
MKYFVGIDLGTTNSAICSYDGSEARIWKSPEQNDVTPSAIYIDRRGNKYVGKRAYDFAPHSPDNSATLFKRLMGTSTPIQFSAIKQSKTPEECSAEVLKVLFGYLPEEIRNDPDTGTVITVPAAFNQMQKDATMQAASMAGLGKVALMQEPVAAVMSVMHARNSDGIFLIYDLGGGTLDVAIAENIGGRVNLLSHGGIAMCGGRDFDRVLLDSVVRPWLHEQFDLPEDFSVNPTFKSLIRLATWATERAKIELSARESTVISLSETEARVRDLNGTEIYIDIPLQRDIYDRLISERVDESIVATRKAIDSAGLSSHDVERIVFVGGPTNYKPLRDKIAFELGILGSIDVNPMTAVAQGASLFAESIDWSTQSRSRKGSRGQISLGSKLALSFNYIARTSDENASIAVQLTNTVEQGLEFQIDSIDTGWTSGRLTLKSGVTTKVFLTKAGENTFKVSVYDSIGRPISLEQDQIVITRTAATVEAIPASHSIGVEVLSKLGGRPVIEYLVRAGDSLPKKGKLVFKAAESLKARDAGSLNLKIWEGDIRDPISDNRAIGVLKISGSDFDDGVIPAGADLICDFELLDSGNLVLEVSVPCIGSTFHSEKNFYSTDDTRLDYSTAAALVIDEGKRTLTRIGEINAAIDSPKLHEARQKLESVVSLDPEETETEKSQEAMEKILAARILLDEVRMEHLSEIQQIDLNGIVVLFDEHVRQHAQQSEEATFDSQVRLVQKSIGEKNDDFERQLDRLKKMSFEILWRQDWFVVARFKWLISAPHRFSNQQRFNELVQMGMKFVREDDIKCLREVLAQLSTIQIGGGAEQAMTDVTNIITG